MHAFSSDLADLYRLADQAEPDAFPGEVLKVLRRWVGFDGAVLGLGELTGGEPPDLHIMQAHVHGRDGQLLSDYPQVSARDPVTAAFVRGLSQPLAVDCPRLYRRNRVPDLDDYTRHHGLRYLMLYGDPPAAGADGRWLVLYRSEGRAFGPEEAGYFHSGWFHISRAIRQHRARLLDRADTARARRATALVDPSGVTEAADPAFVALLRLQWPALDGRRLPKPLLDALQAGSAWRGDQVEVRAQKLGRFLVCTAARLDPFDALSPALQAVARRFAEGQSYKAIARELGVSPHTVRTQLSQVYVRLGVHDKAALALRVPQRG